MLFINLILTGIVVSLCYTILSYIFKIRLWIIFIMILTGIGNVIYLRWIDDNHIIFSIVVGLFAQYFSMNIFLTIYEIIKKNVLEKYDWERPLCIETERCKICGSTRIWKSHIVSGSDWDNLTITHHCNKCGHYWIKES